MIKLNFYFQISGDVGAGQDARSSREEDGEQREPALRPAFELSIVRVDIIHYELSWKWNIDKTSSASLDHQESIHSPWNPMNPFDFSSKSDGPIKLPMKKLAKETVKITISNSWAWFWPFL